MTACPGIRPTGRSSATTGLGTGSTARITAGTGPCLDLSEPVFNLGGAVPGVMASHPMVPTVFTSTLTPLDHYGWLKFDKERLRKVCDWHIAKNCESRRRFVFAFPLGNFIIFYVTCSLCSNELPNRI